VQSEHRTDEIEPGVLLRVIHFPLVTMAIALAVLLGFSGLAGGLLEVWMRALHLPDQRLVSGIVVSIVMVLAYKLIVRHLGRNPRDDLSGPGAIKQLAAGLAIGLVLFSAIVAVAALFGIYRIVGLGSAAFLVLALVNDGLFPAVSEELLFRGVIFRWVEEFGGSWLALIVSAALFGASHLWNPNATWFAVIGIAVEAGLMLGAAYMLTRKLWLSMGIHASWNVSQGEIYDIPVSGNAAHGLVKAHLQGPPVLTGAGFGLEASLIAIVAATAFGCWLLWLAAIKGEVVRPSWTSINPPSSSSEPSEVA